MSAWVQVVDADGSDEWLELCNAALLEVQREQSRRNAAKIRNVIAEARMRGLTLSGEYLAAVIDSKENNHG
ncbi:hypothetical protein ACFW5K_19975 [Streptomyces albidoflavus]